VLPNIVEATGNKVACCFDNVDNDNVALTLLLVWTELYTEQIEQVVTAAFNKFAPLRRRQRRPSKHVTRWLSLDAVNAKCQRR